MDVILIDRQCIAAAYTRHRQCHPLLYLTLRPFHLHYQVIEVKGYPYRLYPLLNIRTDLISQGAELVVHLYPLRLMSMHHSLRKIVEL
jgi:hypothetical protein